MWEDYLPITGKENIDYLWCKSKYPTELDDLKKFPKDFKFKLCWI